MKKIVLLFAINCFFNTYLFTQKNEQIEFVKKNDHEIEVLANEKPFTAFFYPDSLPKPILFPIYAADGEVVTRGYPIAPRPNEPTDHPHHNGLWLNYENVNGLDFWNNSYAIPADKKNLYGSIKKTDGIAELQSDSSGSLAYKANWDDEKGNILLTE